MSYASKIEELIAERDALLKVIEYIGTAAGAEGGELFPVGPHRTDYAEDGVTVVRHVGPWCFLNGRGDTFLAAVQDAMAKEP